MELLCLEAAAGGGRGGFEETGLEAGFSLAGAVDVRRWL